MEDFRTLELRKSEELFVKFSKFELRLHVKL